jgi:hypothetical protein
MSQLLRLISTNEITLLKDMDNLITINKKGKWMGAGRERKENNRFVKCNACYD